METDQWDAKMARQQPRSREYRGEEGRLKTTPKKEEDKRSLKKNNLGMKLKKKGERAVVKRASGRREEISPADNCVKGPLALFLFDIGTEIAPPIFDIPLAVD